MVSPERSERLAALLRRRNGNTLPEPDPDPEPALEAVADAEWKDTDPLPLRPGLSKAKPKGRHETPSQKSARLIRNREYMRKQRAKRKRAGIMALEAGCPVDVPDELKTNTLARVRKVDFVNPPLYETAEDLWQAALEYFKWNDEHPLITIKPTHHQGEALNLILPRLRGMSINALATHMGIAAKTWRKYREKAGFVEVCDMVEQVIYTQKLEGAMGDQLNSAVSIRELGLKDQSEVVARTPITGLTWRIIPRGERAYEETPADGD